MDIYEGLHKKSNSSVAIGVFLAYEESSGVIADQHTIINFSLTSGIFLNEIVVAVQHMFWNRLNQKRKTDHENEKRKTITHLITT